MQIGGREPRLPVMRVHDVRHELRDRTAVATSAAARPSAAKRMALSGQSRPSGADDRDCPAGA